MVKQDTHLRDIQGWREDIGMKTYLHGPTDYYAKKPKLRFCVGHLDLPKRRKEYASCRGGRHAHKYVTVWHNTHIARECETYKEKRDAIDEDIRKN